MNAPEPAPIAETVRVIARRADGSEVDVTQSVKLVYDLLGSSMDYGSGFLSIEDVVETERLAAACGFTSYPDADKQIATYLRATAAHCPVCDARVREFASGEVIDTGRIMICQPCGHEMELFMPRGEPASLRPRPARIDGDGDA